MSELKILLAESPDAEKKDFLATAEALSSFDESEDLPLEITLDRYTRDPWCRHKSLPPTTASSNNNNNSDKWQGVWLKSTDKRGRLPGFIKFLKGRKKAAFGKFESPHPDEETGDERTALFLVPFEQPPFPSKDVLDAEGVSNVGDLIFIKYCYDERDILSQPKSQQQMQQQQQQQMQQQQHQQQQQQQQQQQRQQQLKQQQQKKNNPPSSKQSSSKSRGGLLGSLLGTQERTNQKLSSVPTKRKSSDANKNTSSSVPTPIAPPTTATNTFLNLQQQQQQQQQANNNNSNSNNNPTNQIFTTSNQVIANFRLKMEKKLLAFESSVQTEIKISYSQAEETKGLPNNEEKEKVSMDVLKYIVYEQTEEIGQDEWVAAKEPSEFMDEATIAIYKAGYAPEEVLEDLNKGEMPDEAKHQQRFMRESLEREEKKKAKLQEEMNMKKANETSHEFKRLNNVKRDRRTIEEIQRDMMSDAKRMKS